MGYLLKMFGLLIATFIFFSPQVYSKITLQEDQYVVVAEKMAAPVGGIDAIKKKIEYPPAAKQLKIQGRVIVLVLINEKGGVDDVKVVRGIGGGCDEEVVEAVKNHKFTPAENEGVPVKSKLSLAFQFKFE
ncbi:MAG: energy transducer TonB [Chlorobiaceae bacterium]|nr:energy transducer TonB [Chlorobiaceae bacterium]MBA4310926.1 energy transducer TonB [Chlorobiaceae bacterium]